MQDFSEELFSEHREWAESIAGKISRRLPPSFDRADLIQVALIQHWRCVESFDASRNVPYQAYARQAIAGAVLMSCRRKNYREATHEELQEWQRHVDRRPRPDELLIEREQWRNRLGPQLYRQLVKVRAALKALPAEDAYLLRRIFLEGVEAEALAMTWGIEEKVFVRMVNAAVRRLRRLVKEGTPATVVQRPAPPASAVELVGAA